MPDLPIRRQPGRRLPRSPDSIARVPEPLMNVSSHIRGDQSLSARGAAYSAFAWCGGLEADRIGKRQGSGRILHCESQIPEGCTGIFECAVVQSKCASLSVERSSGVPRCMPGIIGRGRMVFRRLLIIPRCPLFIFRRLFLNFPDVQMARFSPLLPGSRSERKKPRKDHVQEKFHASQ
ncbi:MAG: hypothetical protein JWL90_2328 [Chthoniobacteraceae bacterium]|nr:hypothetical protein [Chthoniobacteraceae bacterium]